MAHVLLSHRSAVCEILRKVAELVGSGQKRNERHDDRRAPRGTGARPGG
jgi:hypothetical protein